MSLILIIAYWLVMPALVLLAAIALWRRARSTFHRGLIAALSVAILSGLLWIAEGEKWLLDRQVRELCAKDGGVKVYETMRLPPEKFDQYGNIRIPTARDAKPSDEYYYDDKDTYYKKGDPYDGPNMWQSHTKVIRRSDGKVLGELIRYTRVGGDIPGPWHPSHFSCSDMNIPMDLEKSIFTKGIEK